MSAGATEYRPTATRSLSDVDRAHARLLAAAQSESRIRTMALFWSAFGAGLAIALSFLAEAAAIVAAPEEWEHLLGSLAYPLGFVIVVLGRYQLFTEQTLPPVALALERLLPVPRLLRVWFVVLFGNLVGATVIGTLLSWEPLLPDAIRQAAAEIANSQPVPAVVLFGRAMLAGWLVAEMVWLIHRTRERAAIAIIWALMALIPLAGLEHVVIGAVEAVYALWVVGQPLLEVVRHLTVVLVGNIVGGVVLVAVLNHGRTLHRDVRLSWREWLLGRGTPRIHAVEGDEDWWLSSDDHPVPPERYASEHEAVRAAVDLEVDEVVIHRQDGSERRIEVRGEP